MWVLNRVIDVCFIIDIFLTFHLAFPSSIDEGGYWYCSRSNPNPVCCNNLLADAALWTPVFHRVFNKKFIAKHYFRGWVSALL